ncbi:MAG: radical SAM protein [Candidatus Bathycorpusculaceae bacterium]
MEKELFEVSDSIPLVGCIAFGLIDRGTNIIQVRPISTCPLSCIFCSTNAGPKSKIRQTEYIVPLDYLVEEFEKIVAFKGRHRIEAHIDTVGDPITYRKIVELVSSLSQTDGVETISMQTHGSILNTKLVDALSAAGLKRINLSLDALDSTLAKKLADTEWYDAEKVVELMCHIVSNTKIGLLIAPVWIPGINDEEIPKIISLTRDICGTKFSPSLGIQKYEVHKHGRKVKEAKPLSWKKFYDQLRIWEKEFKVKLVLSPKDFGIHKRVMLPIPYKKHEIVRVKVVGPGWLKREKLAVTAKGDRSLTLINAEEIPVGAKLKARIVANKHNLLIAEPI